MFVFFYQVLSSDFTPYAAWVYRTVYLANPADPSLGLAFFYIAIPSLALAKLAVHMYAKKRDH